MKIRGPHWTLHTEWGELREGHPVDCLPHKTLLYGDRLVVAQEYDSKDHVFTLLTVTIGQDGRVGERRSFRLYKDDWVRFRRAVAI